MGIRKTASTDKCLLSLRWKKTELVGFSKFSSSAALGDSKANSVVVSEAIRLSLFSTNRQSGFQHDQLPFYLRCRQYLVKLLLLVVPWLLVYLQSSLHSSQLYVVGYCQDYLGCSLHIPSFVNSRLLCHWLRNMPSVMVCYLRYPES